MVTDIAWAALALCIITIVIIVICSYYLVKKPDMDIWQYTIVSIVFLVSSVFLTIVYIVLLKLCIKYWGGDSSL